MKEKDEFFQNACHSAIIQIFFLSFNFLHVRHKNKTVKFFLFKLAGENLFFPPKRLFRRVDEYPSYFQLFSPSRRNLIHLGCSNDPIDFARIFRQAGCGAPTKLGYARIESRKTRQIIPSERAQLWYNLKSIYMPFFSNQMCQECALPSGTKASFQYCLSKTDLKKLKHKHNRIRLRNSLSIADRQSLVIICQFPQ